MLDEPKRVFSITSVVVTPRRRRLREDTITSLIVVKA